MVEGRENLTAASAAYLNKGMEPTAYSIRSSVASASGSGLCLAFGVPTPSHDLWHATDFFDSCC